MARGELEENRQARQYVSNHRRLLLLVNGVFVGVGGVFLTTESAMVTAIAAAAAVLIALAMIIATAR